MTSLQLPFVEPPALSFSSLWQVLGPFQIGTREAAWGADPLEFHGGFRCLEYDRDVKFKSSLTPNATVAWSSLNATVATEGSDANASLDLSFPEIDWQFIQSIYGWSALQYQAWARGQIIVGAERPQTVLLYTDRVLEFWLDGKPYFGGDFYAYRKAPVVLYLVPGAHQLDLRLIRDGRAMGSVGDPTVQVDLALVLRTGFEPLELADKNILAPDVVDGNLAGQYGSLAVRNIGNKVIQIVSVGSESDDIQIEVLEHPAGKVQLKILPGQTRPLSFRFHSSSPKTFQLQVTVTYTCDGSTGKLTTVQDFRQKSIYEPHKITFKHPGGIISYAMLRPPSKAATCKGMTSAPILLFLHGAGLDAASDMVAHTMDPLPDLCAWTLFPTGVTNWSGDDWHSWGFADVEAAISSIEDWTTRTSWQGIGVDSSRWLVSGHSNGGQGAWYTMTHRPDKIIAAAPVSGYASIERYVPYEFWRPMDPRRQSILRASINSYRHELLVENCQGIPIFQQHGSADDNVPAYHSRLMNQLLLHVGTGADYVELPGEGHYFDGIMTTEPLSKFYERYVPVGNPTSLALRRFAIVVANPGDMSSKGGITVTQLETPGQYGRMDVSIDPLDEETCIYSIGTSNILSFMLKPRSCTKMHVIIDGKETVVPDLGNSEHVDRTGAVNLSKVNGSWAAGSLEAPSSMSMNRRGRQLGTMDAILRTDGIFAVFPFAEGSEDIALQIIRNMYQYFFADAAIEDAREYDRQRWKGSKIIIAVDQVPTGALADFPIRVLGPSGLSIREADGSRKEYDAEEGLSAIFLRPGEQESVELVIWGSNVENAAVAARLVPMLTGVGQPDFIVLSKSSRWKGAEGALAMGFFDQAWNVTSNSFFS
ncbi:uncharacterized protein K452DRAFT_106041 [Aplosporella prunicola CBS 121167]|uniref:Peptidase S9 prolyl oligopeptidase catalytic domain-containing protein n=1 Tax=Aplosporella prunicola CBS 121167 TaxID=1176127 RepID=A0A6A6BPS6_9PEZI|nr:uncharacterized protein K452DRAFT_106041 [Aplosporella prunicola CBS 121167]KAF2146112.1 hypothetical protein K452DRAFT_106041 [Aplosporella prunicola CBS 121167]